MMKGIFVAPLVLSALGTVFIIKAFQYFILGSSLKKRGVVAKAILHCPEEDATGFDRYFVSFTQESGQQIKVRLPRIPGGHLKNGDPVDVLYDADHPTRVLLRSENIYYHMSIGCFLMSLSMISYNISVAILMDILSL